MREKIKRLESIVGMDLIDYCQKIFEEDRKIMKKCHFPVQLLEDYVNNTLEPELRKYTYSHIITCNDCLDKVIRMRLRR